MLQSLKDIPNSKLVVLLKEHVSRFGSGARRENKKYWIHSHTPPPTDVVHKRAFSYQFSEDIFQKWETGMGINLYHPVFILRLVKSPRKTNQRKFAAVSPPLVMYLRSANSMRARLTSVNGRSARCQLCGQSDIWSKALVYISKICRVRSNIFKSM